MPIERDANGRFKKATSASRTTTVTTTYSTSSMPVSYTYPAAEKVPFYDYRPVLALVTSAGIKSIHTFDAEQQEKYAKYKGAHVAVYSFSGRINYDQVCIDLNLLPEGAWNDATGTWNQDVVKGMLPCFRHFGGLVYDGSHPLIKNLYYDSHHCEGKWQNTPTQIVYSMSLLLHDINNKKNIKYPSGVKEVFMTEEPVSEMVLTSDFYTKNGSFRFCKGIAAKTIYNTSKFEEFYKLCAWYSKITSIDYMRYCLHYLDVLRKQSYSLNGKATCSDMLDIPNVSHEEKLKLIQHAQPFSEHQDGYCISYPMLSEFEDPGEFMNIVKEHLSRVPDLKITYLRKRHVFYFGGNGHPDGLNYNYNSEYGREQKCATVYLSNNTAKLGLPESVTIGQVDTDSTPVKSGNAILYIGEAWMVYFTIEGKDVLAGNHLYFITPEQYAACYANHPIHKNKYVTDETGKPIALPDLIYLAQASWCERANGDFKDDTTDFQTPYHRRMPLYIWILSNLIQRTGIVFKGIGTPQISALDKINKLNSYLDNTGIAEATRGTQTLTPEMFAAIQAGQIPVVESVAEPVTDPWHIDPNMIIDMNRPIRREPVVTTNREGPATIEAENLIRRATPVSSSTSVYASAGAAVSQHTLPDPFSDEDDE